MNTGIYCRFRGVKKRNLLQSRCFPFIPSRFLGGLVPSLPPLVLLTLIALGLTGAARLSAADTNLAIAPKVTITNLLAHKEEFKGKRVEVAGYYLGFLEHYALHESETAYDRRRSLWINPFPREAPGYRQNIPGGRTDFRGNVRVIGTFEYDPDLGSGHLNGWPAEITKLELFEATGDTNTATKGEPFSSLASQGGHFAVQQEANSAMPKRAKMTQQVLWTRVEYDDRGLLDPNTLPTPAEKERSAAFFGPATNVLANLMLPWNERLLNRIHEPSIHALRTNAARQEYRLVFQPDKRTPVVLHFRSDGMQPTLRVYNWKRIEAPYLSEPPLATTVPVPASHWADLGKKLDSMRFWEMPSCLEWWTVKDGYYMLLEVLDRGRYHLVLRAATEDDLFESLCRKLLELAPVLPAP